MGRQYCERCSGELDSSILKGNKTAKMIRCPRCHCLLQPSRLSTILFALIFLLPYVWFLSGSYTFLTFIMANAWLFICYYFIQPYVFRYEPI